MPIVCLHRASRKQFPSSVVGCRLGHGQRHLTLGVPGGLLCEECLPLRGASLFDEDGAATAEPDVEVVAVVRRQADLRRLHERHVDGDATALGRLLVGAPLVRLHR